MAEYATEDSQVGQAQTLLTEDRFCPGCKKSVVDENGGVVVAFGQSFFHVDCFKCAKCSNQVTADTNLLLLSDGSPICANCSYSCSVCQQPILDEAIMTGDESYHAHCFKCKVCENRIDELVFAKTRKGIYCMNCHNERVARSKRHQARNQERQQQQQQLQQQSQQQQQQTPQQQHYPQQPALDSGRQRDESNINRPMHNMGVDELGRRTSQVEVSSPDTAQYNGSLSRSSSNRAPDSVDSHSSGPSSAGVARRGSVVPSRVAPESYHRQFEQQAAAGASPSATSPPPSHGLLGSPVERPSGPLSKRHSGMFIGLPSSPSMTRVNANAGRPSTAGSPSASSPIDHYRASPTSNTNTTMQTLSVPTSTLNKRKSFDPSVRPLNVLRQVASSASLNHGDHARSNSNNSNQSSSSLRGRDSPISPLRDYFNTLSPDRSDSDYQESPISPAIGRNLGDYPARTAGRARSSSSSAYVPETASTRGPHPPRPTLILDRMPSRSTSLGIPSSFEALEAESPSNLILQRSPVPTQRRPPELKLSLSRRKGYDEWEDQPGSGGRSSVPPSPAHFADVPHGIESGTDTESDDHHSSESQGSERPPSLPPKESSPMQAQTPRRPNDLRVDVPGRSMTPAHESEGSPESSPVERTSVATYIAPALPPIRISMGAGDFDDYFNKAVSKDKDKDQANQKQKIAMGQLAVDVSPTPPNSAGAPTTPKSDITVIGSADHHSATPMKERNGTGAVSPTSSSEHDYFEQHARGSLERERGRLEPNGRAGTPPLSLSRRGGRERVDSNASRGPPAHANGAHMNGNGARITVTAPSDGAEGLRRRLQDAVGAAAERGAGQVALEVGLVQSVLAVLDRHISEYAGMKQSLDGMKRASKQYIDGLTVAQTEYDRELKARRDAEAEVTRLRVLLSGQAVRLTAISGDSKRQEAQKQLAQERTNQMSSLERDLSKLKVERDMTLAEVEQLSASRSSSTIVDSDEGGASLTRNLSMRFDNIKVQYQHELIPLNEQRETLQREIAELQASRDAILEETTVLNKRNEELAQLNAQYQRRLEQGGVAKEDAVLQDRRNHSFDRERDPRARSPPMLNTSVSSTTLAYSEEGYTNVIRVTKPDAQDASVQLQQQQQVKPRFIKWPGSKAAPPPKENVAHINMGMNASTNMGTGMNGADGLGNKPKMRTEHAFQQVSVLRVARCDHCGDKMWGSQLRCNNCNIAVHTRCIHNVNLICSQQTMGTQDESQAPLAPLPPSMFGRDLIEQVHADSRDEDRMVPVVVEKCIDAVDSIALEYEGIYRKTGGSGQSKMITQLFERGDYASFDLRDSDRFNDICSVTSVLKAYFRALPNPLLTFSLHDKFISASTIRDPAIKASTFMELIHDLPPEHYFTLKALMLHLHRVCERSEHNLMHARNLGVVFGPTLMRSPDPGAEFSDMAGKALCIEWLVENAQRIFESQS